MWARGRLLYETEVRILLSGKGWLVDTCNGRQGVACDVFVEPVAGF